MEGPSHQTSKHHGERGPQRERQQFHPWTVGTEEKDVMKFMPCPGGAGLGRSPLLPPPPTQHRETVLKTIQKRLLAAGAG